MSHSRHLEHGCHPWRSLSTQKEFGTISSNNWGIGIASFPKLQQDTSIATNWHANSPSSPKMHLSWREECSRACSVRVLLQPGLWTRRPVYFVFTLSRQRVPSVSWLKEFCILPSPSIPSRLCLWEDISVTCFSKDPASDFVKESSGAQTKPVSLAHIKAKCRCISNSIICRLGFLNRSSLPIRLAVVKQAPYRITNETALEALSQLA